jgi:putative photosynthetic complex assembly protein 2
VSDSLNPVAFVVLAWWLGTGLVFLFERATRGRPTAALAGIVAFTAISLAGIARASMNAKAAGAYLGFGSSIVLWGALELSFLTGLATGPRRRPCTQQCPGWRHFVHAVQALLYHELALVAAFGTVLAIGWNHPNPTAAWSFGLLWVMRQSAKLNLFLGVRNPAVELLPRQLEHLRCYFGSRRVTPMLPVSVGAAVFADILLLDRALAPAATHADRVAGLMLATLLALAILEHLMLVLPVRADVLWIWATQARAARASLPPSGRGPGTIAKATAETIGPALQTVGPAMHADPAHAVHATNAAHPAPPCRLESFSCATAQLP